MIVCRNQMPYRIVYSNNGQQNKVRKQSDKPDVHKMVTRRVIILLHCYCSMCDHSVDIKHKRVKWKMNEEKV